MGHLELVEEARDAIQEIYDDESVTCSEVVATLRILVAEANQMIESLVECIKDK